MAVIAQTASDPMAWSAIAILSPVLVLPGVLLVWIGVRGRQGRLKRNAFAGIRTPTTMKSDEAWKAAHRAGGTALAVGGIAMAVSGALLLIRPSNAVGMGMVFGGTGVVMVAAIVSAVQGTRAAGRVD